MGARAFHTSARGRPRRGPAGIRAPGRVLEDAPEIAELVNESMIAEIGTPWTNVEEMRDELGAPGRDTEHDDALLLAHDGTPAGYLELWAEDLARDKVHLAPSGDRVVLDVARFAHNEPAGRLFESLGYEYARTFWMMRIELDGDPPRPAVPAGIRIRTFEPGRDERELHGAFSEAFAEHWGHPFPSFEHWRHFGLEGEGSGFDPSLWFLAVEGDEIVGAACCRASTARRADTAEVNELAVREPRRRRGIGLALLHTSFAELRRRGVPRVELGVDSENATGATRLYERAGMHVAYAWEFWEKELRA